MKQIRGVMVPDWDTHLETILDKYGLYQRPLFRALSHCRGFGKAVDVGAHIGLWSRLLGRLFRRVSAFEPNADNRECFSVNVPNKNVTLFPYAVGEECCKRILSVNPTTSMKCSVMTSGKGPEVEMVNLDSMDLGTVDLVKFDCEGYDYFGVRGAERTIRSSRPVVMVEQHMGTPSRRYGIPNLAAVELLQSWGFKLAARLGSDYILLPGDNT